MKKSSLATILKVLILSIAIVSCGDSTTKNPNKASQNCSITLSYSGINDKMITFSALMGNECYNMLTTYSGVMELSYSIKVTGENFSVDSIKISDIEYNFLDVKSEDQLKARSLKDGINTKNVDVRHRDIAQDFYLPLLGESKVVEVNIKAKHDIKDPQLNLGVGSVSIDLAAKIR